MAEEKRGRKPRELDTETIKEILDTDSLPTTQEIRQQYNEKKDDTVAWDTMDKTLKQNDSFKSYKVAGRTGWDTR